jgi:hypothetical protein
MAKTQTPAIVSLKHGQFQANALPDPFDERDLEYRPRLQLLPDSMDMRERINKADFIYNQGSTSSCTGHAVASMVNIQLLQKIRQENTIGPDDVIKIKKRISPYMLYYLGRQYDEFEGADDVGSSLRGVLKGWLHHGLIDETRWESLEEPTAFLDDDPDFGALCRAMPLGAYYRINSLRLDDMQSAITELGAIVVSAAIHDGWKEPIPVERAGETMYVICRSENARPLGGHAFALVGYNEIGFLVQNSWGTEWGNHGFATLPYEDWLDCGYDAWVARLGVPQTPLPGRQQRVSLGAGRGMIAVSGPNFERLKSYIVNLGNNGRLSQFGRIRSNPNQIEGIFELMKKYHDTWAAAGQERRHIVLYAHGGLVSEQGGIDAAHRHVNWWLNNHVFPIYFAWQTGASETLVDQLVDSVQKHLPFGAGEGLWEQLDRRVEKIARSTFTWMWDEMKENARLASEPYRDQVDWKEQPGASLLVRRIKEYVEQEGKEKVAIHLVGHSAGSIFHAHLLGRLHAEGINVDSISYLAPGIRVDDFVQQVLPLIGKSNCRFSLFNLSDELELDDCLQTEVLQRLNIAVYQKSLLYLVSRALERPNQGEDGYEVPLLGMQRFCTKDLLDGSDKTLENAIKNRGGKVIYAMREAVAISKSTFGSQALRHGEFNNDPLTMTSVLLHILRQSLSDLVGYSPDQPLKEAALLPPVRMSRPIWQQKSAEPAIKVRGIVPAGLGVEADFAEESVDGVFEIIHSHPVGRLVLAAAGAGMDETPPPVRKAEVPVVDPAAYPLLSRLAASGWEYLGNRDQM